MDPVKKPRRSQGVARGADAVVVSECSQVAPAPTPPEVVPALGRADSAAARVAAANADAIADEAAAMLLNKTEAPRGMPLSVELSHQLHSKLLRMARDEGIGLEGLVQELLAEGVTLRAWEIIERKSAMRGPAQVANQPGPGGNRPFNNNSYNQQRPNGGNNNRGPSGNHAMNGHRGQSGRSGEARPPASSSAWMEDKAAFLDYVRNQEKRRR